MTSLIRFYAVTLHNREEFEYIEAARLNYYLIIRIRFCASCSA